MNFIDAHFHLDLWNDPKLIIDEIEKNKIYTIAVTNLPSVFSHTFSLTDNTKYIRCALGYHPEIIFERQNEFPIFLENLDKTRFIGEIGLDFSKQSDENKREQRNMFEKIIRACSHFDNKILTIHSRGSYKDVIDIIGNNFSNKVILHWYSGSIKELERAVEFGFFFSINYPMTVSKKGREIINYIPRSKILTESDGPFTLISNYKCSPLTIPEIIKNISLILKLEFDECKQMIFQNFSVILK